MSTSKFQYQSIKLSVRFSTVIFPFDLYEFLVALPDRGYVIPGEVEAPEVNQRVSAKGIIGKREKTRITVESERGIVGVSATDCQTVIEDFNEVENLISSVLNFG